LAAGTSNAVRLSRFFDKVGDVASVSVGCVYFVQLRS